MTPHIPLLPLLFSANSFSPAAFVRARFILLCSHSLSHGFEYHTLMAQIYTSFPHAALHLLPTCLRSVPLAQAGTSPHHSVHCTQPLLQLSDKALLHPCASLLILLPVSTPFLLRGPLDMLVPEPLDLRPRINSGSSSLTPPPNLREQPFFLVDFNTVIIIYLYNYFINNCLAYCCVCDARYQVDTFYVP